MRKVLSLVATLGCLAAGGVAASPGGDLAAERAAVAAADREFDAATAQGGADAWASYFAEDGMMLSDGGGAIRGRQAILEAMVPFLGNPDNSLRWKPLLQEVSNDATLAYTVGSYHLSAKTAEGQTVSREGKYLSVWRREADGTWKVAVDLGNPGLPFPEGTEPPAAVREAKGAAPSRGAEAEEESLRQADAAFQKAVAERGAEACAEFFADDGVLYDYGRPVAVGPQAAAAVVSALLAGGVSSLAWEPLGVELSGDASLGLTYGWFETTAKGADGEEKVSQGKYATVWRKLPDGSWKVVVDVANTGFPGISPKEGTPSAPPSS